MNKSRRLHLTLQKKWFDMVKSGDKKEEYREIKIFWTRRLTNKDGTFKQFYDVVANNGYQRNCPSVNWIHLGVRVGRGRSEWGADPSKDVYILSIGDLINQ